MIPVRLTVARLFNLGDYEHARLELSVDLDQVESPTEAGRRILAWMEARRPLSSTEENDRDYINQRREAGWTKALSGWDPNEQPEPIPDQERADMEARLAHYEARTGTRLDADAILHGLIPEEGGAE